jgi:hypothetical protein
VDRVDDARPDSRRPRVIGPERALRAFVGMVGAPVSMTRQANSCTDRGTGVLAGKRILESKEVAAKLADAASTDTRLTICHTTAPPRRRPVLARLPRAPHPARSREIGHRADAVAGRRAGGGGACLATVTLGPAAAPRVHPTLQLHLIPRVRRDVSASRTRSTRYVGRSSRSSRLTGAGVKTASASMTTAGS